MPYSGSLKIRTPKNPYFHIFKKSLVLVDFHKPTTRFWTKEFYSFWFHTFLNTFPSECFGTAINHTVRLLAVENDSFPNHTNRCPRFFRKFGLLGSKKWNLFTKFRLSPKIDIHASTDFKQTRVAARFLTLHGDKPWVFRVLISLHRNWESNFDFKRESCSIPKYNPMVPKSSEARTFFTRFCAILNT